MGIPTPGSFALPPALIVHSEGEAYELTPDGDRYEVAYNGFGAYEYSFIEHENADVYRGLFFPSLNSSEDVEALKATLKAIGTPTIAIPTKGGTAVWYLMDRDDEGVLRPRAWMGLTNFEMGRKVLGKGDLLKAKKGHLQADIVAWEGNIKSLEMDEKTSKRLSALNWRTYVNGTWDDLTVVHGVAEVKKGLVTGRILDPSTGRRMKSTPYTKGKISVLVFSVPENIDEAVVDGNSYIRPELVNELITDMFDRLEPLDPDKATWLWSELRKQRVWNARFLFDPERMDKLDLQMFPQEQGTTKKSNRQHLAHFYGWLYAGVIEPALTEEIDRWIKDLMEGKCPRFITDPFQRQAFSKGALNEDDSIGAHNSRIISWLRWKDLSLTDSPALMEDVVGQVVNMYAPDGRRPDESRFPVPYSWRVSMKSTADLRFCGYAGPDYEMEYGEAYLHPSLGLIVSDETFIDLAAELGGGDKDDHDLMDARVASSDAPDLGIRQGEVVLITTRNPIGYASDGVATASEYFILRPSLAMEYMLREKYGDNIPLVDLNSRPHRVGDLSYPADTLVPTKRQMPTCYTKGEYLTVIEAIAEEAGAYGTHANICMVAAEHRIPLAHWALEETYVDICQQLRNVDDFAKIHAKNIEDVVRIVASEVSIDRVTLMSRRLGIAKKIGAFDTLMARADDDGMWSRLRRYHNAEMKRFKDTMAQFIESRAVELRAEIKPVSVSGGNGPLVLRRVSEILKEVRKEIGIGQGVGSSHRQFEEMGNRLAERMDAMDPDLRMMYLMEARRATLTRTKGHYDKDLHNGNLGFIYAEALVRYRYQ